VSVTQDFSLLIGSACTICGAELPDAAPIVDLELAQDVARRGDDIPLLVQRCCERHLSDAEPSA